MEGIFIAIQRSELPICVKLDTLSVVNVLQEKDLDRSMVASLIAEIKHLLSLRFGSVLQQIVKHIVMIMQFDK